MGLNWNVSNIKDNETTCWTKLTEDWGSLKAGEEVLNPVTETLIWLTLSTGIPQITEKTAPEFLARVRIVEATYGAMLHDRDSHGNLIDKHITAKDVHSHIGLNTNASTLTKTEFVRNLYKSLLSRTTSEFERLMD